MCGCVCNVCTCVCAYGSVCLHACTLCGHALSCVCLHVWVFACTCTSAPGTWSVRSGGKMFTQHSFPDTSPSSNRAQHPSAFWLGEWWTLLVFTHRFLTLSSISSQNLINWFVGKASDGEKWELQTLNSIPHNLIHPISFSFATFDVCKQIMGALVCT